MGDQSADLTTASADVANGVDAASPDPLWDNLAKLIQAPAKAHVAPIDTVIADSTPTDSTSANSTPTEPAPTRSTAIARPTWGNGDSLSASLDSPDALSAPKTAPAAIVEVVVETGSETENCEPDQASPALAETDSPFNSPSPQPLDWLQTEGLPSEARSFNLKERFAAPVEGRSPVPAASTETASVADTPAVAPISPVHGTAEPIMFMASGPSPILYPLRPAKKLKSLAAVELPTFPQR